MAWTERYVRADANGSGNGTTDANSGANGAWTIAQMISSGAAGQRMNIKAGTYANTTTNRTGPTTGTTTAPIWLRGFNTTIGDCDLDPTLARPEFTFTTGQYQPGPNMTISSVNFTGANTASTGVVNITIYSPVTFKRCRIENTAAHANGLAISCASGSVSIEDCYFKATTTANSVVGVATNKHSLQRCVIQGGIHGVDTTSGASFLLSGCIFKGQAGDCVRIRQTGSLPEIEGCLFYGPASDGIEISTMPTIGFAIRNNYFVNCGGYGIRNSTGTNTAIISRSRNAFYNNTSGKELGFGDSPSLDEIVELADPFVNAAGGDFTLKKTALGYGVAFPFENLATTVSYGDVGAVQHEDAARAANRGILTGGRL